jgi:putative transcriptional regulator
MNISHHLSDETLQDYTAGALDGSMEVVIACHLTYCNSCRARASTFDATAAAMLEETPCVTVNTTADALLDRAKNSDESTHPAPQVTGVPRPLARLLPATLEALEWKRLAPGIKQYNLTDKHRKFGAFKLLHLAPGVVLSQHTHQDKELTLVLRGSYQDEIGRFKAGDVADLGEDVIHQPVVDTQEPCIALIATQSPVRFSGVMGRLMQPFVGI